MTGGTGAAVREGGAGARHLGAVGPVRRHVEGGAGGGVVVEAAPQVSAGVLPAGQVVAPGLAHTVYLSSHQVSALLA